MLPFLPDDVICNHSSYILTEEEADVLKNGLNFGIPPPFIKKSDVFTTFEMINRFATMELKNQNFKKALKTEISHLAHQTYCEQFEETQDTKSIAKHHRYFYYKT